MYVPDDIVMQVGFGKEIDSARDTRPRCAEAGLFDLARIVILDESILP